MDTAVLFVIILMIYLIPIWVAQINNKRQLRAICALNILLGWTLIGWVAALVWALMHDNESGDSRTEARQNPSHRDTLPHNNR